MPDYDPIHCIRIPDWLWQRAQARADRDGVKVSAVVRAALEEYVEPSCVHDYNARGLCKECGTDAPADWSDVSPPPPESPH